jgi:HPr kinase/phosphorylase
VSAATLLHGTSVAIGGQGVLILGQPGAGKSDLALRLIDEGGALVADDQVLLSIRDGFVMASAPEPLQGFIEIRGIGIVSMNHVRETPLSIVVELQEKARIERMPEPETHDILGILLPLFRIDPAASSSPARIRAALRLLADRGNVRRFHGGGHEIMTKMNSLK